LQKIRAYILRIDDPTSRTYSKTCSDSCDDVGLAWEYFEGYQNMTGKMAFAKTGIQNLPTEPYQQVANPSSGNKAMCCTAGHFGIWKAISEGAEDAAVVLEHDAIMLHPMNIDIPDNTIVVLGYKLVDPSRYDHEKAGPPNSLIDINGHEGAHAYAITKKTAKILIEEIGRQSIKSAVDNDYFIRGQRRTSVPLKIASPTPAMGWLRKSTIWGNSAARNYEYVPSFQQNYK
jgi:GR25 family glycosyltransferase involved in LPS biosynthesis